MKVKLLKSFKIRVLKLKQLLKKLLVIGEKRKADLLKAFGTVKAIKNAEPSELEAVLPKNAAMEVWNHFHTNDGKEKKE